MMGRIIQVLAKLYVATSISSFINIAISNSFTSKASSNKTTRTASANILRGSNINNGKISKRLESVGNVKDKTIHSSV